MLMQLDALQQISPVRLLPTSQKTLILRFSSGAVKIKQAAQANSLGRPIERQAAGRHLVKCDPNRKEV